MCLDASSNVGVVADVCAKFRTELKMAFIISIITGFLIEKKAGNII